MTNTNTQTQQTESELVQVQCSNITETALKPVWANCKSFYKKAYVITEGDKVSLRSYNTIVVEITDKPKVFGTYSNTTLRHIKEFLKQYGFKAESKKQIEEDYQ